MMFLPNVRLVNKLRVLILIPILGMLTFIGLDFWGNLQLRQEAIRSGQRAEVMSIISQLLSSIQKERGLVTVMGEGYSEEFAGLLEVDRESVDQLVKSLMDERITLFQLFDEEEKARRMETFVDGIGVEIRELRKGVENGFPPGETAFSRYSELADELLDAVTALAFSDKRGAREQRFWAYSTLMQFQEALGKERAIIAAAFKRDSFNGGDIRFLETNLSLQNYLIKTFAAVASEDEITALEQRMSLPETLKAKHLRDLALAMGLIGGFSVEAKEWWDLATQRIDAIETVKSYSFKRVGEEVDETLAATLFRLYIFGIIGLGVILVSGLLGQWMVWDFGRHMDQSVALSKEVAEGNLYLGLESPDRGDEVGMLLDEQIRSVRRMIGFVRGVKVAYHGLEQASKDLGRGISAVSNGSQEIIGALRESALVLERMKDLSFANMDKAKEVAQNSHRYSELSREGVDHVVKTIEGMDAIRARVSNVGESVLQLGEQMETIEAIIETVNELSEQSNMLAVNAAIEAGLAGEHGKGFSVVAQQMKTLSSSSKEATVEVCSILNDIKGAAAATISVTERGVHSVEKGMERSKEARESIRVLGASLKRVGEALREVEASGREQVEGMSTLSASIQEIRQASRLGAEGSKSLERGLGKIRKASGSLHLLAEEFQL